MALRASVLLLLLVSLAGLLSLTSSLTVHLVPHTHDDVGWLKTVDQYYVGLREDIQDAAVQHVITSVVQALKRVPERKFIYVEQAFFQRWWRQQNDDIKALVKTLVNRGQLEFINGGWCMHDEAATHYVDMIDQTTLGHQFILDEFGVEHIPTVGWQIDPFGHSATQAALLSAAVGFDGLFFGRIDYQDRAVRLMNHSLEVIWSASKSYGPSNYVFAGAMDGYGPPGGLCWDHTCGDTEVQDDPLLEDYNVDEIVARVNRAALRQAAETRGDVETMQIMWTMGSDFQYENAEKWYINLDRAIKAVNKNGTVHLQYSTPSLYVKAKNAEKVQWPVKTDDYFPYADGTDAYWTGYFTSRPALKGYVRTLSSFLQVVRHFEVFTGSDGSASEPFWEAQSVAQHHDGVSGTAKQAVTYDYAQRLAKTSSAAADFLQSAIAKVVSKNGQAQLNFTYCPLANVSYCPATANGGSIAAVIYNPAGHSLGLNSSLGLQAIIRVPVPSQSWRVYDGTGRLLPQQQVVPVLPTQAQPSNAAKYEAVFGADVAAIGLTTAFLVPGNDSDSRHRPMQMTVTDDAVSIENAHYTLNFDGTTGLLSSVVTKADGATHPFTQDFAWYPGYQVDRQQDSGAYIFRPSQQYANPLTTADNPAKILGSFNGALVSQVWQQVTPWIVQKISLYHNNPAAIEFEWTVGPIPFQDGQGKEIVIRFNATDIDSAATWYTDSNGREFQQRVRNARPTWKWTPTQPIAGNYYPVNAVQWLADDSDALVVANDRSQGGSSLADGSLEFMVHRRLLRDDGRGVSEPLNETGLDGQGLIITGRHLVSLVKTSQAARTARVIQNALFQSPHVSYAPLSGSIPQYAAAYHTNLTYVASDLPDNVELMTAQVQSNGNVLIRLAHSYGVGEDSNLSKAATVDLNALFNQGIGSVSELGLSAVYPAGSHKVYEWNTTDSAIGRKEVRGEVAKRRRGRGGKLFDTTVTLQPLEIRTFSVSF